ncbi:hypothetical protein C8R44DRAFT_882497 [Mycena epipterygia]|nr:hypothetical protein C8R44DRAFT_882497 [Mycena epipterygia]
MPAGHRPAYTQVYTTSAHPLHHLPLNDPPPAPPLPLKSGDLGPTSAPPSITSRPRSTIRPTLRPRRDPYPPPRDASIWHCLPARSARITVRHHFSPTNARPAPPVLSSSAPNPSLQPSNSNSRLSPMLQILAGSSASHFLPFQLLGHARPPHRLTLSSFPWYSQGSLKPCTSLRSASASKEPPRL